MMSVMKPRVATDGLYWGAATVTVPITLALVSVIGIAFVDGFRMGDAGESELLAVLVAATAILIALASVVSMRTASRVRAGIAMGVAVGSLVAVYGGVILVVR